MMHIDNYPENGGMTTIKMQESLLPRIGCPKQQTKMICS